MVINMFIDKKWGIILVENRIEIAEQFFKAKKRFTLGGIYPERQTKEVGIVKSLLCRDSLDKQYKARLEIVHKELQLNQSQTEQVQTY